MRHRLAYLGLRGAVAVVRLLPEPVMRRLGQTAGLFWYVIDSRRRRLASRHMRRLGAPPGAARRLFASYGRYLAEELWVTPSRFPALRAALTIDGLEHLEAAKNAGTGVVLVLAHTGNWDAAALVAMDIDLPLVAVAERLPNPFLTDWFIRQRAMFGMEVILTGAGRRGQMLREALEAGKAVALLADRDLSGRGTTVEFFGEKTKLPNGPTSLARKTGAPLLPVGVYFKRGAGHRAVIHPPMALGPDPGKDVASMAARLEDIIRRHPDQWHLVQSNWPSDRV